MVVRVSVVASFIGLMMREENHEREGEERAIDLMRMTKDDSEGCSSFSLSLSTPVLQ